MSPQRNVVRRLSWLATHQRPGDSMPGSSTFRPTVSILRKRRFGRVGVICWRPCRSDCPRYVWQPVPDSGRQPPRSTRRDCSGTGGYPSSNNVDACRRSATTCRCAQSRFGRAVDVINVPNSGGRRVQRRRVTYRIESHCCGAWAFFDWCSFVSTGRPRVTVLRFATRGCRPVVRDGTSGFHAVFVRVIASPGLRGGSCRTARSRF